jgi:hypothetical protein
MIAMAITAIRVVPIIATLHLPAEGFRNYEQAPICRASEPDNDDLIERCAHDAWVDAPSHL